MAGATIRELRNNVHRAERPRAEVALEGGSVLDAGRI
jgi:hypothetical protein